MKEYILCKITKKLIIMSEEINNEIERLKKEFENTEDNKIYILNSLLEKKIEGLKEQGLPSDKVETTKDALNRYMNNHSDEEILKMVNKIKKRNWVIETLCFIIEHI